MGTASFFCIETISLKEKIDRFCLSSLSLLSAWNAWLMSSQNGYHLLGCNVSKHSPINRELGRCRLESAMRSLRPEQSIWPSKTTCKKRPKPFRGAAIAPSQCVTSSSKYSILALTRKTVKSLEPHIEGWTWERSACVLVEKAGTEPSMFSNRIKSWFHGAKAESLPVICQAQRMRSRKCSRRSSIRWRSLMRSILPPLFHPLESSFTPPSRAWVATIPRASAHTLLAWKDEACLH